MCRITRIHGKHNRDLIQDPNIIKKRLKLGRKGRRGKQGIGGGEQKGGEVVGERCSDYTCASTLAPGRL